MIESELRDGYRTALVLMKSREADATIEALASTASGAVVVRDGGPYWKLSSDGDIHIDMDAVGLELGESISLNRWLVIMSSFVGRVITDERSFTLTSRSPVP